MKLSQKEMANKHEYRVVCISIYDSDLQRLDDKVSELRQRGHRVSRSQLIRYACDRLDINTIGATDQLLTPGTPR